MIEISTVGTIHISTKDVKQDTNFKVNLEKNIIKIVDGYFNVFYFNSKETKLVYKCEIKDLPPNLYVFGVQVVENKKIIDDYLTKSILCMLGTIPFAGLCAYGVIKIFEYFGVL